MDITYLKEKRILIVDDEQELLDMVVSILKEDGFRNIRTASSVKDALETAGTFRPELAILDVMLPDGSGFSRTHRSIRPPSGVNLTAFPTRFNNTL